MMLKTQESISYDLIVENGKFIAINPLSDQDGTEAHIYHDGSLAQVRPWTATIHTGDGKHDRILVHHPSSSGVQYHLLNDGALRLSYRANGRPYSKFIRPEDLSKNQLCPLPFRFYQFYVTKGYLAPRTDGKFVLNWTAEGDSVRELNWIFSDGEVKYRSVNSGREIGSLQSPALKDVCDRLEATVDHSLWTVHFRLEQHNHAIKRTGILYCNSEWANQVNLTAAKVTNFLDDYLYYHCAGASSFLTPLKDFLL